MPSRFAPRTLALLPFVLLASVASAQETLTLGAAIDAAVARNPSLRAAHLATREADAEATEARAGLFPRVTVSEAWQRGNEPVYVFGSLLSARRFTAASFAIDALNHPDPTGFFRTTVSVEQVLFDGGLRAGVTRAATLKREISGHAEDSAAANLVVAVTEAFGRVLTAQAVARTADAGVVSAREDTATIERRRDAGLATEADVLGLRVHLADLEQRAIQASGEEAVARAELNRLMGAPIARRYDVVEPPPDLAGAGAPPDDAALLAEAEANRPDLKRAVAAGRLADAARRQARAALIPQVAAQSALIIAGTQPNDRASSWLVGGELRWTFSTGGAELARLKAASAARERAAAERADMVAGAEVDVLAASRRLEAARARQRVGQTAVAQAHEGERIIRNRFEAGLASVADVLRAATAVLDSERLRVGALVDMLVSRAQLDRATGRVPSGDK